MQKPSYDIEDLIGIYSYRDIPKSYYETLHSGHSKLGNKYLDLKLSKNAICDLIDTSDKIYINKTRSLLKQILCCKSSFVLPIPYLRTDPTYYILNKIKHKTNWINYSETIISRGVRKRNMIRVDCENVITMGDYNFYLRLKECCINYINNKDVINIIMDYLY